MTRLDSARVIDVLADVDPAFDELTQALYGGQLAPDALWRDVFAKISPDPTDVSIPAGPRRPNRLARAAAITATTVGTVLGAKELGAETPKALKVTATGRRAFRTPAGWLLRNPGAKLLPQVPRPGPAARVTGIGAMFGGDILAARQLRQNNTPVTKNVIGDLADGYVRQARQVVDRLVPAATGRHRAPGMKAPTGGAKPHPMPGPAAKPAAGQQTMFDVGGNPSPEGATVGSQRGQQAGYRAGQAFQSATATPGRKAATSAGLGVAGLAAVHHHRAGQGQAAPAYLGPTPYYYSKRSERDVEVEWAGTFSKLDADKQLAFGWATVSKMNGLPVVDRQGDIILPEDIEDAVYHYVVNCRVGGDMHRRTLFGKHQPGFNAAGVRPGLGLWEQAGTDNPHKVADLVESMVFTDEKVAKMGLPDEFPRGWWVGFRYHDDEAWADIKEGRKTGFSIHGKGVRTPVDVDELVYGAVH